MGVVPNVLMTCGQPYHDLEDEPTAEPLDPRFFDFDMGEALSKEQLKGIRTIASLVSADRLFDLELIWEEIARPDDKGSMLLSGYS